VKKWGRQILQGLAYLHNRDPPVVHGDLRWVHAGCLQGGLAGWVAAGLAEGRRKGSGGLFRGVKRVLL
jgi:hypothetical protein